MRGASNVTTADVGRWARTAGAWVVLAGACMAAASEAPDSSEAATPAPERGGDPLAQALLDCRAAPMGALQLRDRIDALGPESLPLRFETLASGHFHVRVGDRGNSTRAITPGERTALITSFAHAAWEDVEKLLHDELQAEPAAEERVAALELLGTFGGASELEDLFAWSEPADSTARADHRVRAALGKGLGRILEHHPEAALDTPDLLEAANPSLALAVLEALGSHPCVPSLEALVDILGRIPSADPFVLGEIARVAAGVHAPARVELCAKVRPYLAFPHDRSRQLEAALAVRHLGDAEAVPHLIALLDGNDRVLRDRAHDTLKLLSGRHFGPLPARWLEWHEQVLRWWQEDAGAEIATVVTGNPEEASRAVLELSKRTLFRHELSRQLSGALNRPEEELVSLVCASLGHLGSPDAVPSLVNALASSSVTVRRAAYLALTRITGEDHGERPRDWRDAGW